MAWADMLTCQTLKKIEFPCKKMLEFGNQTVWGYKYPLYL